MRSTLLPISIMLLASNVVAAPGSECREARTTVDLTDCLVAETAAADATLQRYLDAARHRIVALEALAAHPAGVGLQLATTQNIWKAYRSAQCGDVYVFWVEGTYRYEAGGRCQLALTRQRTHDVWSAYLLNPDASSELPEP